MRLSKCQSLVSLKLPSYLVSFNCNGADFMELSEKIRLSRKKKAMSQEELANLLNVSRQAVQKWESGASKPEIDKLVQISNLLDVSLDFLLKDKNSENDGDRATQNTAMIKDQQTNLSGGVFIQ